MDDFYSEVLWQLPDDQMYTVQHKDNGTNRWQNTDEFGTQRKMKERAMSMPDHRECRLVRLSKYPPHSVVEVVYYKEAKR